MCGITGAVWSHPDKRITPDVLSKMALEIRHRGPDDERFFHAPLPDPNQSSSKAGEPVGVALGFRRLSIIDLDGSPQPIANEDQTIQLVFNGEIYNYRELRDQLRLAGHHFQSDGDAESIVHLYEQYGTDCFSLLNGQFALAIWDSRRNRLILARDRLGQKPLVYRNEGDRLLFASELKSLLAVPGIPREIDPIAVDEYLTYQYVPHPHCILKGFEKLCPGHFAVYENRKLTTRQYWNPDNTEDHSISIHDAAGQLRELFRSSIQLRMQSDVPLGAFLSGGIDSSLVVASMVEQSERPIKTFSIGFPIAEFDESIYASQVAAHLGTEHRSFNVTPDARSILDELVYLYDEPFGDSSAIPTWYVAKHTREHVTVALSGDGGDELFAGYNRYKAVRLAERFDRLGPLKQFLAANIWQKIPSSSKQKSRIRQLKRFSQALGLPVLRRYLDWIGIFNADRRAELYQESFSRKLSGHDSIWFLDQKFQSLKHRDTVSAISLTDLQTYLPCDLNTKVDIASMGHSLECRQPFLDYRIAEFAMRLPVSMKLRSGQGKFLLKKAFGDRLPANIWRRKKMGFGVPIGHWFRTDLKELLYDTVLKEDARCHQIFSRTAIQKLNQQHQKNEFDHSYRLWSILMLELWFQKWLPS
jgi:asparagine synthase (glutamine-hydrolysing)